ncbi:TraM recognition domain-containing protein [Pseudonocardia kujensis]|uniref:type IV secretory system conjugative DNA transfer family protein n=1 Tax=Pseudonocardia kujensis TaxID=1128675 RepID=UPI001E60D28A|nr:TraM recognition domain-containing protein [Pseudonocardia kujensis]MCE0764124.1 TraM recognition domain-containing protein [Pseudonocardia kujensis]
MSRYHSPTADRDLALAGVALAGLGLLVGAAGLLGIAVVLASGFLGAPLSWPDAGGWWPLAFSVLAHPADPGAAVGPPWAEQLIGHPQTYWFTVAVLAGLASTVLVALAMLAWRRWGPTGPGHASRREIRRELSLAAARRTAEWTRPSLSRLERKRAPLDEVGAPLHRGAIGPMCSPLTSPTGTLAPTQTGKSRRDLVHKALGAPGALLCSTTKPDLLEFVALARTRRFLAGPVLVFDATGTTAWPAQLRWSPIQGCHNYATAERRAHTMVEASAVAVEAGGGAGAGNDRVFRERAKVVLTAYLHAAALGNRGISSLIRWATARPADREPVGLLEPYNTDVAKNLASEMGMVDRTADAVWMSVRRVIEPLMSPALRALCSPRPGEGFDARSFIGNQGSLFLIAGRQHAAAAVPLLTALAEEWLTTATDLAKSFPTRRLEPPATAVLDELTNATPAPSLPDIVSDSAGQGVVIHWAAQSRAQLDDAFGTARARLLLDNTTTLSLWGGLKDTDALEWASTLGGHHERIRHQAHSDGFLSPGRASIGTETAPTFRPGAIRMLEANKTLVYHRALRPIVARTVDVSERPDWKQLRADQASVRAGVPAVDELGYSLSAGHRPGTPIPSDR